MMTTQDMTTGAAWPPSVAAFLQTQVGGPTAVERLGGMSHATVTRVRGTHGSVVVKGSPSEREALVYEHLGAELRQAGIPVPQLRWSTRHADLTWLVLEDIPQPAPITPQQGWHPDPRMVTPLARLHARSFVAPPALATLDEPAWTDAATELAVSFFPPGIGRTLRGPLRALQAEGQSVLEPWCWIQGDPNPTNWGIRTDGTWVLYDWERFRRGTPAVDLAILITGNGDAAAYAALAALYLAAWSDVTAAPPWRAATLARQIALAKVWVLVSLLGLCLRGQVRLPDRLPSQLQELVPPWLHQVAQRG